MGKLFKSKPPEPPPIPPPPPPPPIVDEEQLGKKKKMALARSQARTGRQSTILQDAETLGTA